jgi:hypothetical protein
MLDQSSTLDLRDAFASLPPTPSTQTMASLRAKVERFVDVAKGMDWPIERVIVAIKEVAAEAGVRSSTDVLRTGTHLEIRDAVLLDVVRWSVERYYGYTRAPSGGGSPPERGARSQERRRGRGDGKAGLRDAREQEREVWRRGARRAPDVTGPARTRSDVRRRSP